MISLPHVKEELWTFVLQFYLDASGLPHLDKASINEVECFIQVYSNDFLSYPLNKQEREKEQKRKK